MALIFRLLLDLGKYDIGCTELRNYLYLMAQPDYPPQLLEGLLSLAKKTKAPSFYVTFSRKYFFVVSNPHFVVVQAIFKQSKL